MEIRTVSRNEKSAGFGVSRLEPTTRQGPTWWGGVRVKKAEEREEGGRGNDGEGDGVKRE